MRMANGMGSVYKIGGKKQRRKPYVARTSIGYSDEGKQLFYYIRIL